MRPEVEKYLAEQRIAEERNQWLEKSKVLIAAGLYTREVREITKKEYDSISSEWEEDEWEKDGSSEWGENASSGREQKAFCKTVNGRTHYYAWGNKIPLDVTDEEYAAILAAMPEEQKMPKARRWASRFCFGLAIFLWVGGLITAILTALVPIIKNEGSFDFVSFLTLLGVYFAIGGLAMCLSEHFDKQQAILEEIKNCNRLIRKG